MAFLLSGQSKIILGNKEGFEIFLGNTGLQTPRGLKTAK